MTGNREVSIEIKYLPTPLVDIFRIKVPTSFKVSEIMNIYEKFHKDKTKFVYGTLSFLYAGKPLAPAQTLKTLLKQYEFPNFQQNAGPELKFFANHLSGQAQSDSGYVQEEVFFYIFFWCFKRKILSFLS